MRHRGGVEQCAIEEIAAGRPRSWARYPAGVFWALKQAGYEIGGIDAAFVAEVPTGAGLSSSVAIESCTAIALSDIWDLGKSSSDEHRKVLAELCRKGENVIARAPTGGMDQAASLRCQTGMALLLDCLDGTATPVRFDFETTRHVLLVINTRADHELSDGQYGARRADCEQACAELGVPHLRSICSADLDTAAERLSSSRLRRRVRHVVTETERVRQTVIALGANDLDKVGRLFTASHVSLCLDYEVSSPELDVAVREPLDSGALGVRMTGGGFGGSAIALINVDLVEVAERRIASAFVRAGFERPPEFLTAIPAASAERVSTTEERRR